MTFQAAIPQKFGQSFNTFSRAADAIAKLPEMRE